MAVPDALAVHVDEDPRRHLELIQIEHLSEIGEIIELVLMLSKNDLNCEVCIEHKDKRCSVWMQNRVIEGGSFDKPLFVTAEWVVLYPGGYVKKQSITIHDSIESAILVLAEMLVNE